jgi:hypothetical protein
VAAILIYYAIARFSKSGRKEEDHPVSCGLAAIGKGVQAPGIQAIPGRTKKKPARGRLSYQAKLKVDQNA